MHAASSRPPLPSPTLPTEAAAPALDTVAPQNRRALAVARLLRRSVRELKLLSVLELGCTASLVPLAIRSGGTAPLLLSLPAAGLYLYRWIRRYRQIADSGRALRLEELFLTQSLGPVLARRCIQSTDHVWAGSLLRAALRGAMARPLPAMLRPDERAERLRPHFERALAGIAPGRPGAEVVIPAVGAVLAAGTSWPSMPGDLLAPGAAVLLLAGVAATVTAQSRTVSRLRHRLAEFAGALGQWAERTRLYNVRFDWRKLHTLILREQMKAMEPPASR